MQVTSKAKYDRMTRESREISTTEKNLGQPPDVILFTPPVTYYRLAARIFFHKSPSALPSSISSDAACLGSPLWMVSLRHHVKCHLLYSIHPMRHPAFQRPLFVSPPPSPLSPAPSQPFLVLQNSVPVPPFPVMNVVTRRSKSFYFFFLSQPIRVFFNWLGVRKELQDGGKKVTV